MFPSFLLSLREGFEAALILGIVFSALYKVDRRELAPAVWRGAAAAVAASILAAVLLQFLGAEFEGRAEEIFEGLAMLAAAVLLTWMIFWMRRQAGSFEKELEGNVLNAAALGGMRPLFFLAFLAIAREGLELALFLTASTFTSNALQTILGAAAGLGTAAFLGILLFATTRRLSLRRFFLFTNILLILFAAGLVAHSIVEFNEAGVVPSIIEHVWDINPILDEHSALGTILTVLLGYNGNPSLAEVVAYLGYFIFVWFMFKKTTLPVPASDNTT